MKKPTNGKIRITITYGEDGGTNIGQQTYHSTQGKNRYVNSDGVIFLCLDKHNSNYWEHRKAGEILAENRRFKGRITITIDGMIRFDNDSHSYFNEFPQQIPYNEIYSII